MVTQGWTCILGGFLYILYDLLIHGCHLDMHCVSTREQQHIAINALLVVVGVDMVFQRSRFSCCLIGMGFFLFVVLHPQPNSMGTLIHQSCGAMLLLYAFARLASRFDVCSRALYYASYLFFYGQNGLMEIFYGRVNDTAYVLYVLVFATLMQTLTDLIDYACAEGISRAWSGAGRGIMGMGAFVPGSPSKGRVLGPPSF